MIIRNLKECAKELDMYKKDCLLRRIHVERYIVK